MFEDTGGYIWCSPFIVQVSKWDTLPAQPGILLSTAECGAVMARQVTLRVGYVVPSQCANLSIYVALLSIANRDKSDKSSHQFIVHKLWKCWNHAKLQGDPVFTQNRVDLRFSPENPRWSPWYHSSSKRSQPRMQFTPFGVRPSKGIEDPHRCHGPVGSVGLRENRRHTWHNTYRLSLDRLQGFFYWF
jgi:hypothetical protein